MRSVTLSTFVSSYHPDLTRLLLLAALRVLKVPNDQLLPLDLDDRRFLAGVIDDLLKEVTSLQEAAKKEEKLEETTSKSTESLSDLAAASTSNLQGSIDPNFTEAMDTILPKFSEQVAHVAYKIIHKMLVWGVPLGVHPPNMFDESECDECDEDQPPTVLKLQWERQLTEGGRVWVSVYIAKAHLMLISSNNASYEIKGPLADDQLMAIIQDVQRLLLQQQRPVAKPTTKDHPWKALLQSFQDKILSASSFEDATIDAISSWSGNLAVRRNTQILTAQGLISGCDFLVADACPTFGNFDPVENVSALLKLAPDSRLETLSRLNQELASIDSLPPIFAFQLIFQPANTDNDAPVNPTPPQQPPRRWIVCKSQPESRVWRDWIERLTDTECHFDALFAIGSGCAIKTGSSWHFYSPSHVLPAMMLVLANLPRLSSLGSLPQYFGSLPEL